MSRVSRACLGGVGADCQGWRVISGVWLCMAAGAAVSRVSCVNGFLLTLPKTKLKSHPLANEIESCLLVVRHSCLYFVGYLVAPVNLEYLWSVSDVVLFLL